MEFKDLYTKDYETVGCKALLEYYLENFQTDEDWDNWLAELGELNTKDT